MRVLCTSTPTPAHAVQAGDRVLLRQTGEVREVVEVAATLTERAIILDDGSWIGCMFLDTLFLTTDQVTESDDPS